LHQGYGDQGEEATTPKYTQESKRTINSCEGAITGEDRGEYVALGVVLVVIGMIFLLESLGVIDAGLAELWPVILIAVGIVIVYERLRRYYRRR
jgi:hypothetical protein